MTTETIKSNGASAAPKNFRSSPSPEARALITNAASLEALFLASAQAVAMENPKDGALLSMIGMAYQDLKGIMLAAQAADMMRAEAASARDHAEAAAATARSEREERELVARDRRNEEAHEAHLAEVRERAKSYG